MANEPITLTRRALKTPRAAAVAGRLFAVLFGTSVTLIRLSVPANPVDGGTWMAANTGQISLALNLMPFAGIAFLWFIGVVRDRLGHLEDQFFSTVFFGSGLLFLAMTFASAALAGGILASFSVAPGNLIDSGVYSFGRAVMYQISNVYAIRMGGVFMISLATIWVRSQTMPRGLAFLTYTLALILLLSVGLNLWVTLIFPGWVLLISLYILISNLRNSPENEEA